MKTIIPALNTQLDHNSTPLIEMAKYINKFTTVPKELFRLNNGPAISLRDRTIKKLGSYDVLTEAGKVKAKAANPQTYAGKSLNPLILAT